MWDAPYCISLKSCFTHRGQGHVVWICWGRMWLTTSGKEIQLGCEVGNSKGGFCQNQLCLQRLCFPALEKGYTKMGAMKKISSAVGKWTESLTCEWRTFTFLAGNSDPWQETKAFAHEQYLILLILYILIMLKVQHTGNKDMQLIQYLTCTMSWCRRATTRTQSDGKNT